MATISKSRGSWRVQIRRQGHDPISKNFPSKAQASRWAREMEHKLETQALVPAALRLTLAEMIAAYGEHQLKTPGRTKALILKMLTRELGHLRLAELTPKSFIDFATRRQREGAGPATLLMDLSTLGTVLKHAGPLLDAIPAAEAARAALGHARGALRHAGRVAPSNERDRRLTGAEMDELMAYWLEHPPVKLPMMDLVLFAIASCMRLGEITRITWADYDAKARTVVIRDRKHPTEKKGNDQVVPLLTHTRMWGLPLDPCRIIERQPRPTDPQRRVRTSDLRIFPYNSHSVTTAFWNACQDKLIIDLNFHDLRHEGISRMFESGYSIEQVAVVSGHKSWDNLRRYTQIDPLSLHRG